MTWSIVTHDPATGAFAVAVATKAFAAGTSGSFVRAGVGAVSTQSMTNRYLGPAILDAMARGRAPDAAIEGALAGDAGKGLRPELLMAAMEAGEAAGGDRRGRQSAAMLPTTTEDFPDLDLRVDDHAWPLPEPRRLPEIWRRERAPGLLTQPRKADPAGITDPDAIESGWIARRLDIRLRR